MKTIKTIVLGLSLCWISTSHAQDIHSTIQLTSPDATIAEKFGWDVCMHGDWIFASAPWDDQSVFGDGGINFNSGSVHCYWWNGQSWLWHSKITAEIPQSNMLFGYNLSFNHDHLLVSAPGDLGNGQAAGAVYQFEWNGNSWVEINRIIPAIEQSIENFGGTITSSGDWLWIGGNTDDQLVGVQAFKWINSAWEYQQDLDWSFDNFNSYSPSFASDNSRMIVGHPENDFPQNNVGGATNYSLSNTAWTSLGTVTPSDISQGDDFGWSIALDGDRLAIGAPCTSGEQSGRIFMYTHQNGFWVEDQIIESENSQESNQLGRSLVIENDILIASAAGAHEIILFSEIEGQWIQIDSFHPMGTVEDDEFGASNWAQDDWIVTGAPGHDSGINFDQGAIYVSRISGCTDQAACNYHSWANVDSSCEFPSCDDPEAMNFVENSYCDGGDCHYFGDLDSDGNVTIADLLVLLTGFGCTGDCPHDLNADEAINTQDLMAWLSAF